MSRQFSYLFAGAAFMLCASASAAAYAEDAAKAPKAQSQTVVRTVEDGVSHEVRVIREADGKVTITRDGKTTVVDPHDAMVRGLEHGMPHHRDMAEHLRAVLQLHPNQDAALQAYVAAMHPTPPAMTPADDPMAPRTTPERLALMQKHLEAHTAMMRGQLEATRRFYDQLDPGQKKAFDELHMSASMGPMHLVTFHHMVPPMPPMPPMPGMPHAPVPPTPPSL